MGSCRQVSLGNGELDKSLANRGESPNPFEVLPDRQAEGLALSMIALIAYVTWLLFR